MKYFKFLVLNVIVFGGLIMGISLLFPSVIRTSKTINIAKEQSVILTKVNDVSTWKDWNTFLQPDAKLTTVKDSDYVSSIWDFTSGRNMHCEIMVYKSAGDSTPVSFMVTEKLKWYPWEKFRAMVSDKAIGNAIEVSLDKFKKQIETTP